jgi:tetratricopeptide (TPR) repeat protein
MTGILEVTILALGIAAAPPKFREAVQAQQTGNHRAAVALFSECLKGDATHGDSYYRRALSYSELAVVATGYREAILDSALGDVKQALGLDTANASAHNLHGLILLRLGADLEGAAAEFTAALRINPRYADAVRNRAEAYRLLRQVPRAIGDLSVAIGLAPHDHRAFAARAELYTGLGQCSLAVGDLTSVLSLVSGPYSAQSERTRAEALRARGDCLLLLDDYDKARADHRQALAGLDKATVAGVAHAWADRASAMQRAGKHAAAEQLYTHALEFTPTMTLAYAGRSRARFALARYAEALADCDTVLAHNPDSYLDLLLRGQVRSALGQREPASGDFSKALEQATAAGAATDSLVRAVRAAITANAK